MHSRFIVSKLVAILVCATLLVTLGFDVQLQAQDDSQSNFVSQADDVPAEPIFNYQGSLLDSGQPANGLYDFKVTIFDTNTDGTPLRDPWIRSGVSVINGYYNLELDLRDGSDPANNPFQNGDRRFLQVEIRKAAQDAVFALQSPRIPLRFVPYALWAQAVDWAGLQHLPTGFQDKQDNVASILAGGGLKQASDGSISLDYDKVNEIVVKNMTTISAWRVTGNVGTNNLNMLGTTDNVSFTLGVSNTPTLRLAPNNNIIGGNPVNQITSDVYGSVIAGGGASNDQANIIAASFSVIGGGARNSIRKSGGYDTIGGGASNLIASGSGGATIAGGSLNKASGGYSTIGGGFNNIVDKQAATVSGGENNSATGLNASVGGGNNNGAFGDYSMIGGGFDNHAALNATVSGGSMNSAVGQYSTIPGGFGAVASNLGQLAYASGFFSNPGDAQSSLYVLRGETPAFATGFSEQVLYLDGQSKGVRISSGQAIVYEVQLVGASSASVYGFVWQGTAIHKNGDSAQNIGTISQEQFGNSGTFSAGEVYLRINDATDSLEIVIAPMSTASSVPAIRWVATVRTVEVIAPSS